MLPEFTITPYGVQAHVPLIEGPMFDIAIFFWSVSSLLAPIGLVLTPCATMSHHARPIYHSGWHNGWEIQRIILFEGTTDNLLVESTRPVTPQWRNICIAHRPAPGTSASTPWQMVTGSSASAPFRFTKAGLGLLFDNPGRSSEQWALEAVKNLSQSRHRSSLVPTELIFRQQRYILDVTDRIVVLLGVCPASIDTPSTSLLPAQFNRHWASVYFYHVGDQPPSEHPPHRCPADHISGWRTRTKVFEDTQAFQDRHFLTLSFSPCPISPMHTLIVSMTYKGETKHRLV